MSETAAVPVRGKVQLPAYRAVVASSWMLFALAWVGGMTDPPAPSKPGFSAIGALVVAVSIVAAARATRVGVIVTDSHVIVRNLVTTRRVELANVEQVRVRNYDGAMTRGGSSPWLCTVALTTKDGRLFKAFGLVGPGDAAPRAAARLRELIGLPAVVGVPQHRAT